MSDARETLVRAMDAIAESEERMGDGAEIPFVAVVYFGVRRSDDGNTEVGGWVHSDQPSWIIAAMLERAVGAIGSNLTPIGTFDTEEED